jgi:hypothetical protein
VATFSGTFSSRKLAYSTRTNSRFQCRVHLAFMSRVVANDPRSGTAAILVRSISSSVRSPRTSKTPEVGGGVVGEDGGPSGACKPVVAWGREDRGAALPSSAVCRSAYYASILKSHYVRIKLSPPCLILVSRLPQQLRQLRKGLRPSLDRKSAA